MTTSGTTAYDPAIGDMVIDAFGRMQIRPSAITPDHMFSARRSTNSVLVMWANRGVNLWVVDEQAIPLIQGVVTYDLPDDTVMMLETWVRSYQLQGAENYTPDLDTTLSSDEVNVNYADHGMSVDDWVQCVIPISIGGLIIFGFYQVTAVPSADIFTIQASANATATASGGVVPVLTATSGSDLVSVELPDHGYSAGDTFAIQVQTSVGGLTLLGDYTIASVTDADNFVITAPYDAASTETVSENDGDGQFSLQAVSTTPQDRFITPLSRTDYASISNKFSQGGITSYYFNRQIDPQVTVWQAPTGNGVQELRYYRMRQVQTGTPRNGQTLEIPYRFLEAFIAELAAHLAQTWSPENEDRLLARAEARWAEASHEDRERVALNITPDLSGYYDP